MNKDETPAEGSRVREQQKAATRARIMSAAVGCLIDLGVARTTTLEVQRRAEISRGALLHHFPTHTDLMCAAIDTIVARNEQAVTTRLKRKSPSADPVERVIHVLVDSLKEPTFLAEIELWVVSRTDSELRTALVAAERKALRDRKRVLDEIFSPLKAAPAYDVVVNLSLEFVRGLAISGILRSNPESTTVLVQQWIWAVKQLLHLDPSVHATRKK
ncbi:TetR/AcrR family transcriptional regulator [Ottowia sp. VDI28]|uniref:TetR/AcrR family transcriptional regulator n=1 Tax=Ottowia sp. VDI28 TaxID=3133968 RepID=UPI003C2F3ACA